MGGVAVGAGEGVVEVVVVDRAAVVETGGGVVGPGRNTTKVARGAAKGLLETISRGGTGGTVTDHLEDGGLRAGVDTGAAAGAVVALHQTRVHDAVVGRRDANAANTLLHDDGKDEAAVDAGLTGHLLNGAADGCDLIGRVVGTPAVPATGLSHDGAERVPELVERAPSTLVGPALLGRAVALEEGVAVGDGEDAEVLGSLDDRVKLLGHLLLLGRGRGSNSRKGEGNQLSLGEHDEVNWVSCARCNIYRGFGDGVCTSDRVVIV